MLPIKIFQFVVAWDFSLLWNYRFPCFRNLAIWRSPKLSSNGYMLNQIYRQWCVVILIIELVSGVSAMHRVASAGNTSNSSRPRKEKRLTYVLNDADDTKVRQLIYNLFYPWLLFCIPWNRVLTVMVYQMLQVANYLSHMLII